MDKNTFTTLVDRKISFSVLSNSIQLYNVLYEIIIESALRTSVSIYDGLGSIKRFQLHNNQISILNVVLVLENLSSNLDGIWNVNQR